MNNVLVIVQSLFAAFKQLEGKLTVVAARLDGLTAAFEASTDKKPAAVESQKDIFLAKVSELSSDLGRVHAVLGDMSARLVKVETDSSSGLSEIASLKAHLAALECTVGALQPAQKPAPSPDTVDIVLE